MEAVFLPRSRIQELVDLLIDQGYDCVGPTIKDHAVVHKSFTHISSLTQGFSDKQSPGHYSIEEDESPRIFNYTNSVQGIKPWVFKPREPIWYAKRNGTDIEFSAHSEPVARIAFFGARACDIAGLLIQDKHFLEQDRHYQNRREQLFLIGVNCSSSAETCFCSSTGTGPKIAGGVDLELSELDDGFVVHASSLRGSLLIDSLSLLSSSQAQLDKAKQQIEHAARQQRSLPKSLYQQLRQRADNKVWDKVSDTCLACGNCTAVCPTCFCSNQRDDISLDGQTVTHFREWDSCFTQQHSYIHGITIREEKSQRYRQWLTHKLDTWFDQYETSGCVGCGRCITWCPVGIDITEMAQLVVEVDV